MEPKDEQAPESEQPAKQTAGNENTESGNTDGQRPNQPASAPKKSRKKLIAIIVAAVVVVLIAGGAVFAYLWYQNPEKMVADAVTKAAQAKSMTFEGTVSVTEQTDGSEEAVSFAFNGSRAGNRAEANIDFSGAEATNENSEAENGQASVVFAGDDGLFFRVMNVREILASMPDSGEVDDELVSVVEENLGNRWISLDATSQEGMTAQFEEQRQCTNNAVKSFSESKSQQDEVADAYRNNRILAVERTGSEDIDGVPSDRFEVSIDESKVDGFVSALRDTTVMSALNNCSDQDILEGMSEDLKQFNEESKETTFELWVSIWSHELTQLRIAGTNDEVDSDVTVRTKFNEDVNIETPTDATPLKDVINELMTAIFSYSLEQQQQQAPTPPTGMESEINQDLMLDLNTN